MCRRHCADHVVASPRRVTWCQTPAVDGDRQVADALGLAGALSGVSSVAALSALTIYPRLDWYESLDKPRLTPPKELLGPAWTFLYANQAVAAWLVWRGDWQRAQVDVPAISSYATQLGLNLAWTLLFFGLKRPGLALLDLCVLWLAIALTIREFARQHRVAAALLLPYLAWITYAGALNFGIWRRNR
jgi:translocator protein